MYKEKPYIVPHLNMRVVFTSNGFWIMQYDNVLTDRESEPNFQMLITPEQWIVLRGLVNIHGEME